MKRYFVATFLFIWLSLKCYSQCPNWFYVGPEVYHFSRQREGGTNQDGWIHGVRVGYDRIKRYSIYIGADFLYATGRLKGETATGRQLRSELKDRIFEFRLGYTLQQQTERSPFFVPFAGLGHFKEINDFFPPSPIPVTFTDSFDYLTIGFLSGVNFSTDLHIGLNLKLKFMQKAQSEVSNDPLFDDVSLLIKDEMLVRVEVPILYTPIGTWLGIGFKLLPFYEFRHFGGREGYPFNFRDTKFFLYGAQFALTFSF